jgi:catechol 2,3-dioxygenase-like lactoylglutathione lyase family enzyme
MSARRVNDRLGLISLLVADYDAAIAWLTGALGFVLREDTPLSPNKRWVVVAPPGGGTGLLLARAATPEQQAAIGQQAGGRVFLFLETDDFEAKHQAMLAAGVQFLEPPRREAYGTVAVFEDLCGNRWDLIEPQR